MTDRPPPPTPPSGPEAGAPPRLQPAPRWTVEAAHLARARDAVATHARVTPLDEAPALGARAWVKRETRQATGSFKLRGALAKLAEVAAGPPALRARGVIAASAGNHGLGVAVAARALGLRARVFAPARVARIKADGIAAAGAELVRVPGDGYDDAEAAALDASARDGATYVSPYADPLVAAGNGGTLGAEIFAQLEAAGVRVGAERAVVVAPVGGGGLLLGLAAARRAAGLEGAVRIVGVQCEASPAMILSLARGRAISRYVGAETLAEGLEGGVDEAVVAQVAALPAVALVTVSERTLARAVVDAPALVGEPVEGSAAVALAYARAHARWLAEEGPLVVVLTGSNVDPETVERARALAD